MNKRQVKLMLDKGFTAEQVKEIYPDFNVECFDIMKAWANGAEVEVLGCDKGDWLTASTNPSFSFPRNDYRIKQPMCKLGDIEFPKPVSEPLEYAQEYWLATELNVYSYVWGGDNKDDKWLKAGLIQLTKEGAELQLKAMQAVLEQAIEEAEWW